MYEQWLKVADFAAQLGCTPANIYRYRKAYPAELEPEMVKQGRFTIISPKGQRFIRDQAYPKTLSQPAAAERISELMAALSAADHKAAQLAQQLASVETEKNRLLIQAEADQRLLEASNAEREAQEAEKQAAEAAALAAQEKATEAEKTAQEASQRAQAAEEQLAAAQAELDRLHKRSWWDRLWDK